MATIVGSCAALLVTGVALKLVLNGAGTSPGGLPSLRRAYNPEKADLPELQPGAGEALARRSAVMQINQRQLAGSQRDNFALCVEIPDSDKRRPS